MTERALHFAQCKWIPYLFFTFYTLIRTYFLDTISNCSLLSPPPSSYFFSPSISFQINQFRLSTTLNTLVFSIILSNNILFPYLSQQNFISFNICPLYIMRFHPDPYFKTFQIICFPTSNGSSICFIQWITILETRLLKYIFLTETVSLMVISVFFLRIYPPLKLTYWHSYALSG